MNTKSVTIALAAITFVAGRVATGQSLHLIAFASTETNFQFQLQGPSDAAGTVEASEDLIHWTTLTSFTVPSSGDAVTLSDPETAGVTNRFYRASAGTNRSDNAVGFVRFSIRAGFNLMANPLDDKRGNRIDTLFPQPPWGTTIYVFEPGLKGGIFRFDPDDIVWTPGGYWPLPPGRGFVLLNPKATFAYTFIGEVVHGTSTNSLRQGFSLSSSIVPERGLIIMDLGLPTVVGMTIYKLGPGGYNIYRMDPDDQVWMPEEPTLDIGESAFILSTTSTNWVRGFSVWP